MNLLHFFYCRQANLGSKNQQSVKQKLEKEKGELKININDLASSMKSTSTISHKRSRNITPLYLWIFFPPTSEKILHNFSKTWKQ